MNTKKFFLRDRETGEIVQTVDGDYDEFLENQWGGWFPFKKDGCIHCHYGQIIGCEDYSKYWSED